MKRLFLDANILIAVLNRELPLFNYAARILSLPTFNPQIKIYTTPLCLAIAYYFAEKKCGPKKALEKIRILSKEIGILTISEREVIEAASDPKVHDFEDGLQYYAAINAGCNLIITENAKDFYFSTVPVYGAKEYLLDVL